MSSKGNYTPDFIKDWGIHEVKTAPKDIKNLGLQNPFRKIPIKNEGPKIGRNEICICGSGKKYKHCCLTS